MKQIVICKHIQGTLDVLLSPYHRQENRLPLCRYAHFPCLQLKVFHQRYHSLYLLRQSQALRRNIVFRHRRILAQACIRNRGYFCYDQPRHDSIRCNSRNHQGDRRHLHEAVCRSKSSGYSDSHSNGDRE